MASDIWQQAAAEIEQLSVAYQAQLTAAEQAQTSYGSTYSTHAFLMRDMEEHVADVEQLEDFHSSVNSLADAFFAAYSARESLANEVSTLEADHERIAEDKESITAILATTEQSAQATSNSLMTSEVEVDRATTRLDDVQDHDLSVRLALLRTREQYRAIREDIRKATSALEKQELFARLTEMPGALQSQRKLLSQSSREVRFADKQLERQIEKAEHLQAQLEELQQVLIALPREVDALQSQLMSLNEHLLELQQSRTVREANVTTTYESFTDAVREIDDWLSDRLLERLPNEVLDVDPDMRFDVLHDLNGISSHVASIDDAIESRMTDSRNAIAAFLPQVQNSQAALEQALESVDIAADELLASIENAQVSAKGKVDELLLAINELEVSAALPAALQTMWEPQRTLPDSLGRISLTNVSQTITPFGVGESTYFSSGNAIYVYNSQTGQKSFEFQPHLSAPVQQFAVSANGTTLASISGSQLVFSNASDGSPRSAVPLTFTAVSVSMLGGDAIVSGADGVYRVSEIGNVSTISPTGSNARVTTDKKYIAISEERILRFLDATSLQLVYQIDLGYDKSNGSWKPYRKHYWDYDPVSQRVVVSGETRGTVSQPNTWSSGVNVYDIDDQRHVAGWSVPWRHTLAISPGGEFVALGSNVWNDLQVYRQTETGGYASIFSTPTDGMGYLKFSGDASVLYVRSGNGLEAIITPGTDPSGISSRPQASAAALAALDVIVSDLIWPESSFDRTSIETYIADFMASLPAVEAVLGMMDSIPLDKLMPVDSIRLDQLRQHVLSGKAVLQAVAWQFDLKRSAGELTRVEVEDILRHKVSAVRLDQIAPENNWYGSSGNSGRVRFVSVGTTQPLLAGRSSLGVAELSLSSRTTGIDFSHEEAVVGVRLRISGGSPLVHVYRQGQLLLSVRPDTNGLLALNEPEGITYVVIERDASSTATIDSLVVVTDSTLATQDILLSPYSNRHVALAVPPRNWEAVYPGKRPTLIDVDPSQYTMISVSGYGKDARIFNVGYFVDANTWVPLDRNYVTIIDAYHWIIHPGAPSLLFVSVSGASVYYRGESLGYEWEFALLTERGATSQQLIPHGPFHLDINVFHRAPARGYDDHYFLDAMPSQMEQDTAPKGHESAKLYVRMTNTGAVTGSAKVELFGVPADYDMDDLGTPQRTEQIALGSDQQRILVTTISFPNTTADTSTVIARVTYADGTTEVYPIAGTARHRERNYTTGGTDSSGQSNGTRVSINPYNANEQRRILRAQLRIADSFAKRGDAVEAERILASIPRSVSGGASSETIDATLRLEIERLQIAIATPISLPEEPPPILELDILPTEEQVDQQPTQPETAPPGERVLLAYNGAGPILAPAQSLPRVQVTELTQGYLEQINDKLESALDATGIKEELLGLGIDLTSYEAKSVASSLIRGDSWAQALSRAKNLTLTNAKELASKITPIDLVGNVVKERLLHAILGETVEYTGWRGAVLDAVSMAPYGEAVVWLLVPQRLSQDGMEDPFIVRLNGYSMLAPRSIASPDYLNRIIDERNEKELWYVMEVAIRHYRSMHFDGITDAQFDQLYQEMQSFAKEMLRVMRAATIRSTSSSVNA